MNAKCVSDYDDFPLLREGWIAAEHFRIHYRNLFVRGLIEFDRVDDQDSSQYAFSVLQIFFCLPICTGVLQVFQ